MRFWITGLIALATTFSACNKKEKQEEKMVDLSTVTDKTELRIAELTGALQQEPKNANLYNRRAMLYLDAKKHNEALQDIDQAIALDSARGEYYYHKAKILRADNKIAAAFKAARQAEAKEYKNPDLYVLTGEMYFIVKEYQKAIDHLNQALKLSPFNEYAYFYKGMVYAESGDTARAISSFQTSVEQAPEFTEGYNQL
ncbi:MAG: tetratricopeptide repeat protein, partial [Hymenobacteraceae bacterium]|nr:tetratricopeptide repeat protein [Hymenobacteraceae bacterium]